VNDLARELAGLSDLAQRLLTLHVPDGHVRCRACTAAGTGIPSAPWPCVLHFYATAAEQIRRHGVERASR